MQFVKDSRKDSIGFFILMMNNANMQQLQHALIHFSKIGEKHLTDAYVGKIIEMMVEESVKMNAEGPTRNNNWTEGEQGKISFHGSIHFFKSISIQKIVTSFHFLYISAPKVAGKYKYKFSDGKTTEQYDRNRDIRLEVLKFLNSPASENEEDLSM